MRGFFSKVGNYFKISHLLFLIPICGFALYDSVFQAFSSILADLQLSYPDVSVTTIQLIISIPPMASIPGTLCAGFLSSYIRKKYIASFALAIIFIGGMIPVVFVKPTIYAMFACSIFVGLGQGLLHPMANAFICQTWEDKERSRALGFKQSFNFVGDALVAFLVGVLALKHWGCAFLVYLGIIPVFILTLVLFPRGELDKRLLAKDDKKNGIQEILKPRMIYLIVLFLFAMMFMYGFSTNIAMLVKSRGLGNTADVSKITSSIGIIACIIGVLYGAIMKRTRRFTLSVAFFLLACGMFVVAFSQSYILIFCGAIFFAVGQAIQQISTIYCISKTVDKQVVTMAIAVAVSFISLGASLSPVVINTIQMFVFGSVAPDQGLLIAGTGYVVLALVDGISSLLRRKSAFEKSKEDECL